MKSICYRHQQVLKLERNWNGQDSSILCSDPLGMFYKKNRNYMYLLCEDFLFQNKNKDAKKINKISYPKFTKIIIDYFMSKDQSISKRNKMFRHTARDDTMYTSMRCIYKNEKTQKADSNTSPKRKPVQATKGTRIKIKAKVAKSDKKKQPAKKPKAKGLAVLSDVALTKAEQLKLATKRSKKDYHISHASGLSDRVDTYNEEDDDKDDFENDVDINDDDSYDNDDERMESDSDENPDPYKSNDEHDEEEEE
nr:hypothetical protein [Tanacetum cinerariifolium]